MGACQAVDRVVEDDQAAYRIVIPDNARGGQEFVARAGSVEVVFRCPNPKPEDGRMLYDLKNALLVKYKVKIPAGTAPGDVFHIALHGCRMAVTCPAGRAAGQDMEVHVKPSTFPSLVRIDEAVDIRIPTGVKPGRQFLIVFGALQVPVTCPPNVTAGQTVRVTIPIPIPRLPSQASTISTVGIAQDPKPPARPPSLRSSMVYEQRDGWMRVLVTDGASDAGAKFKWFYSTRPGYEPHKRIDIDKNAFVRHIAPGNQLKFVSAGQYSLDSALPASVASTAKDLVEVSKKPFEDKVKWLKSAFSKLRIAWENGHVDVKIHRATILADSLTYINRLSAEDMHKIFRFEFIGEPGIDAGGLTREWYTVLSEQLFNPDCGLFLNSTINQMCMQINPNSGIANEHHLRYFHLAGRVLGKALMDGQITPVHLVQPLYKHLMGWPISLHDLEHVDDEFYRSLFQLLDMEDASILCMNFTVTEDKFGAKVERELIENGANIDVTNDNLGAYLGAQLRHRLLDCFKPQLSEFLRGFYDVVPEPLLSVFDYQELELVLHGLPNIDMNDWRSNTEYTGEFANNHNHRVIQWFWEIVTNYSHENRAKLLQFTTGTAGVPAMGFGFLQGNNGSIRKFTLHGMNTTELLPRSHTCFNRLDVPLYKSKADAQKYITMAITLETTGFDIQ